MPQSMVLLKGNITLRPGGSTEPLDLAYIYIYIYNFFFYSPKIKVEYLDSEFCLNPIKVSLDMIILILFSQ